MVIFVTIRAGSLRTLRRLALLLVTDSVFLLSTGIEAGCEQLVCQILSNFSKRLILEPDSS
jgi:hypothetical protein